uniref:Uncharacterized protein n=1 Tax=Cacopsylla melanoneura TaxID=428564 RepID=A0A8D8RET4_9HEMI
MLMQIPMMEQRVNILNHLHPEKQIYGLICHQRQKEATIHFRNDEPLLPTTQFRNLNVPLGKGNLCQWQKIQRTPNNYNKIRRIWMMFQKIHPSICPQCRTCLHQSHHVKACLHQRHHLKNLGKRFRLIRACGLPQECGDKQIK